MKKKIQALFKKIGCDIKRCPPTDQDFKKAYDNWKGVAWGKGYDNAKNGLILQTINDQKILNCFLKGDRLPEKFGIGFDERCVEYPWLFANFPKEATNLLDAGSVLNFQLILDHSLFSHKQLHILTLAPENNCFWQKKISYLYDDLRNIPIRDNYYDAIICLSTLEHIGCDNTLYTQNNDYQENRPEELVLAIRELRRVLKPGGSLFLSVPFGVYRYFGTFQQFDRKLLSSAIETFGEAKKVTENFYRYTSQGWQIAKSEDCAECEYVEWITKVWQESQMPNPIPVEQDLAAAARAVACVHLVKA